MLSVEGVDSIFFE